MTKQLAILAGAGELPLHIAELVSKRGMTPHLLFLQDDRTPQKKQPRVRTHYAHTQLRLGQVGKMLAYLRLHDIKQVVMAGSIRRPSWTELVPDAKALQLLPQLQAAGGGIDQILRVVGKILKAEGFALKGVGEVAPELLAASGVWTKRALAHADVSAIEHNWPRLKLFCALDCGQAMVAQGNMILAFEDINGTDALIAHAASVQRKDKPPVLYKMAKPQQSVKLDLPTVGVKTIQLLIQHKYRGLVIEAGRTLAIDAEKMIQLANQHNIFIVAVPAEKTKRR